MRTELAQSSLSTSSHTFRQYCWPYLHGKKVKPRIVPELEFSRWPDNQGKWQTVLDKYISSPYGRSIEIPIADTNPPDYIIGFERISFK